MSRAILDVQILVPGFIQNVNKFVYICRWPNGLIKCFSNISRRINVFLLHFYGITPSKNKNIQKAKHSLADKFIEMWNGMYHDNVRIFYVVVFECFKNIYCEIRMLSELRNTSTFPVNDIWNWHLTFSRYFPTFNQKNYFKKSCARWCLAQLPIYFCGLLSTRKVIEYFCTLYKLTNFKNLQI